MAMEDKEFILESARRLERWENTPRPVPDDYADMNRDELVRLAIYQREPVCDDRTGLWADETTKGKGRKDSRIAERGQVRKEEPAWTEVTERRTILKYLKKFFAEIVAGNRDYGKLMPSTISISTIGISTNNL